MLIDTHCHLDAKTFIESTADLVTAAQTQGVQYIVIPAIDKNNFLKVQQLAQTHPSLTYALGIHPLFVPQATSTDLLYLEQCIQAALDDARFVAIGEIGLDFFVPELTTKEMSAKQTHFYVEQLKLAKKYKLPVLVHVRRSQDQVLKYLRRYPEVTGIAHAFNGSHQQAEAFIKQGFALGVGGAMTFTGSKQIRRLASALPLEHLVLETDAPDIPPAWLDPKNQPLDYNRPAELKRIAQTLADLRQISLQALAQQTTATAFRVLPRLQNWHHHIETTGI